MEGCQGRCRSDLGGPGEDPGGKGSSGGDRRRWALEGFVS